MQGEREPKSAVVCVLRTQSKARKSRFDTLGLLAELGSCVNDGTHSADLEAPMSASRPALWVPSLTHGPHNLNSANNSRSKRTPCSIQKKRLGSAQKDDFCVTGTNFEKLFRSSAAVRNVPPTLTRCNRCCSIDPALGERLIRWHRCGIIFLVPDNVWEL